ncbi:MAG: HlyD family type I secretion periplasmic adaptor subunit [Qingshengfaniella sp.]
MSTRPLDALERELNGRMPVRASLLLLAICALLGTVIAWAILTWVDDVTRAPGKVVPAADIQQVQATQDGVIRAVLVEEGQVVAADTPLVELDALVQTSQFDRERLRALALQARITRLSAEIDETALTFAPALEQEAPGILSSERALFAGRAAELAAQIAVLEQRRAQRLQERAEAENELTTTARMQTILAEERAMMMPLIERGVEPQTTLLRLRREEENLTGRSEAAQTALDRSAAALAEVDHTIRVTRDGFLADALRELADATAELAALQPTLPALEGLAARAVLRAPVHGVINSINRRTIGGAVRPGEDLVEIVPLDDALRIEAYVRPQDIAFLRPDQPVRVKLTAYDFTRYGALDGTIVRIGANAVRRSERDEGEVFVVVVQTEGALHDADGEQVQIIPGMTAEIDILAGQRRVIDYLLQPIQRVAARAFRE